MVVAIMMASNGMVPRSGTEVPFAWCVLACMTFAALFPVSGSYEKWEHPGQTVGAANVKGNVVAPSAEPAVEVKGVRVHVSKEASAGMSFVCCMGVSAGYGMGVRQPSEI